MYLRILISTLQVSLIGLPDHYFHLSFTTWLKLPRNLRINISFMTDKFQSKWNSICGLFSGFYSMDKTVILLNSDITSSPTPSN